MFEMHITCLLSFICNKPSSIMFPTVIFSSLVIFYFRSFPGDVNSLIFFYRNHFSDATKYHTYTEEQLAIHLQTGTYRSIFLHINLYWCYFVNEIIAYLLKILFTGGFWHCWRSNWIDRGRDHKGPILGLQQLSKIWPLTLSMSVINEKQSLNWTFVAIGFPFRILILTCDHNYKRRILEPTYAYLFDCCRPKIICLQWCFGFRKQKHNSH